MREETILIGNKSELIDYFRNELGVLTKIQEIELKGSDPVRWGRRNYKVDISDDMSIETQVQNIENFGKVFYMDEAVFDNPTDIIEFYIELTGKFVYISEKEPL